MEETDFKNPVWGDLVHNKMQVNLSFLGGKILLSRLQTTLKNNSSPAEIEKAKRELFDIYYKNRDLPSVKQDISNILKRQLC